MFQKIQTYTVGSEAVQSIVWGRFNQCPNWGKSEREESSKRCSLDYHPPGVAGPCGPNVMHISNTLQHKLAKHRRMKDWSLTNAHWQGQKDRESLTLCYGLCHSSSFSWNKNRPAAGNPQPFWPSCITLSAVVWTSNPCFVTSHFNLIVVSKSQN